MSDDRLRIPCDPEYISALGLAALAFARLEWDAVWCCERLMPGYINTIEAKKKTAGTIAKDMENLFLRVSDAHLASKIGSYATEFKDVVLERNGLLHGKPGTAQNGSQRLFRHGGEWTIEAVNRFSDRCVRAGEPLNALLYGEFKDGNTVPLNPA